jgi:hypothetical protein
MVPSAALRWICREGNHGSLINSVFSAFTKLAPVSRFPFPCTLEALFPYDGTRKLGHGPGYCCPVLLLVMREARADWSAAAPGNRHQSTGFHSVFQPCRRSRSASHTLAQALHSSRQKFPFALPVVVHVRIETPHDIVSMDVGVRLLEMQKHLKFKARVRRNGDE